jgi:uncharacterized protein YjiS (DUF1127 family)
MGPFARASAWLRTVCQRRSERNALRDLSPDAILDIGLTPEMIADEIRRWPWEGRRRPETEAGRQFAMRS